MTTKEKKRSILGPAGDRSFHLTNLILLSFFFLIVLYPIIYVVSSSFSSAYAVITNKVWLWPVSVTLDGYKACFKQSLLMTGYLNSMLYMIFGTLVNVVLLVLAGYPLSRRDLPGKGMFVLYFTFTMFFSGGMIPNYMLVKNLGLIDNRLAMIIAFYANNTDRFLRWVSNFYQVTPNEHYRVDVDGSGEVVACFTTEEYKMALEYAHSLYAEGLILQDSFSISVDDLRAIGEAPAGETLGLIIGWGPEEGVVKAGDTNRWFDYFVLAPVEGENGQRHTIYNANYPCQGGWFITDKCPAEYVQYAVRLGDLFLDEYYGYSAYLGVKGVAWDDPSSEEALGINGEQAWFRELVNYGTQPVNSSWDQKAPSNRYAQFRLSQEADGAPEIMEYCDGNLALKDTVVPLSSYNEVMKYYGCQKNLEKYAFGAEWCVPALLYDPSIADQANDSETAINEYRKEMAVAFITGTRSLDEYDAYVEELYTMGLQLVLDAKNDAYSVLK